MQHKRIISITILIIAAIAAVSVLVCLFFVNQSHVSQARNRLVRYRTVYKGRTYDKTALVYLPRGYQDSSKKYNVLFLMHGWGMSENDFIKGDPNNKAPVIDDLMKDEKNPFIVVSPTYYPNWSFTNDDEASEDKLTKRFAKTEINQVLKVVQAQYHVYKSRNHYAFAGFSFGAITGWAVMQDQLSHFRYFQMIAGGDNRAAQLRSKLLKSKLAYDVTVSVGSDDYVNNGTPYDIDRTMNTLKNVPHIRFHIDENGSHDLPSAMRQLKFGMRFFFK
ncbi:MAG: hypothetical protein ABF913_03290 [Oenococcus sp.]|uniref:alpha/beta hydrolase n=1 Tax=Oenococcus sp. TaxID=1979414 RepID=UPI0039E8522B